MKQRAYRYFTNCVHSTAEKIDAMVEKSRQITWETFRRFVSVNEVRQVFPFYSYQGEKYNPKTGELTAPMHIKDDWAVSFHKSKYEDQPCVYITHSEIEYIFLE